METLHTILAVSAIWAGLDLFVVSILMTRPARNRRKELLERLAADVKSRKAMMEAKPPRGPDGRYITRSAA